MPTAIFCYLCYLPPIPNSPSPGICTFLLYSQINECYTDLADSCQNSVFSGFPLHQWLIVGPYLTCLFQSFLLALDLLLWQGGMMEGYTWIQSEFNIKYTGLPTHVHYACVKHLWIKNFDHTYSGPFHTPDSQFRTTCSLTITMQHALPFPLNQDF